MPESWDLETQQVMSFNVSFFTVLIPAIRGCLVTSSPVHTVEHGSRNDKTVRRRWVYAAVLPQQLSW